MEELNYHSLAGLVLAAEQANEPLSALVLRQQAAQLEQTEEEVFRHMEENFRVMAACIEPGCDPDLRSTSGLTGGDAAKMRRRVEAGQNLTGPVLGGALYRALAVSELNAAMGRIVAAPTAGSCGILPAVLLTMEERGAAEHDCVMSMFTASAVGLVIAENACLAGAQGGCQAECGRARPPWRPPPWWNFRRHAPDAGRRGGHRPEEPAGAGLRPGGRAVEIPCIKRNAAGAAIAFMAAELALAGISSRIPADEVIVAMRRVGNTMSPTLKETAEGALPPPPPPAVCANRCSDKRLRDFPAPPEPDCSTFPVRPLTGAGFWAIFT